MDPIGLVLVSLSEFKTTASTLIQDLCGLPGVEAAKRKDGLLLGNHTQPADDIKVPIPEQDISSARLAYLKGGRT